MTYDPDKRDRNKARHAIDLAECESVFDAPMLTREDTRLDYGEQRFISLGMLKGQIVVLVWTDREDGPRIISCRSATFMNKKRTSARTPRNDVPYKTRDRAAVQSFWDGATAHTGVAELRAKRGRPKKAAHERKEQIALRLDADVVAWYRALGAGWQTRMNAVLKAYRDATI
jgi:uncharacterized protein (DUF4415 family)